MAGKVVGMVRSYLKDHRAVRADLLSPSVLPLARRNPQGYVALRSSTLCLRCGVGVIFRVSLETQYYSIRVECMYVAGIRIV